MSATVGYATLQIIPSAKGFASALSGQVTSSTGAAGATAGKTAGKKFGGTFTSVAGPLIASVFAVKAFGFLKDAVGAASDLGEVQSKVNVIFGKDGAKALDTWSNSSATAMGQSKTQALDAAATFGVFAKSAGLGGTEAAGFSTKMTGLASDLASFSNTSTDEAITAIGAALRGESEPIRRYGVLLDDATLRQEAMRLGLVKTTTQALTPQQRVLAAQSQILKQTKDAQGDFARTSGGLANQQRILAANFENVKTKVGSVLLPVVTSFVTFLNANLMPAFQAVQGFLSRNTDLLKTLAAVFGPVVAVVLVFAAAAKVAAIAQGLLNAALLANPIGLVILAIVAVVAAIVLFYKKSETFRKVVQVAFAAVMAAIRPALNFLTGTVWPVIKRVFSVIATIIRVYVAIWLAVVIKVITGIVSTVRRVIQITEPIRNAFGNVVSFLSGVIGKIASVAGRIWNALTKPFADVWDTFSGIAGDVADGIWSGLQGAAGWLADAVWGWVKSVLPWPVRKALGIDSPSKVMAEQGFWAARGMEEGIRKGTRGVANASREMAAAADKAAGPPAMPGFAGSGTSTAGGALSDPVTRQPIVLTLDGRVVSETVFEYGGRKLAHGRV